MIRGTRGSALLRMCYTRNDVDDDDHDDVADVDRERVDNGI